MLTRAVDIGKMQMEQFERGWPDGFYNSISKNVVTFALKGKHIKVGEHIIINQEAIYARIIGLLVSDRNLDLSHVFACELAAFPTALFKEDGKMRIATAKATLKKHLAVTTFSRIWGSPNVNHHILPLW